MKSRLVRAGSPTNFTSGNPNRQTAFVTESNLPPGCSDLVLALAAKFGKWFDQFYLTILVDDHYDPLRSRTTQLQTLIKLRLARRRIKSFHTTWRPATMLRFLKTITTFGMVFSPIAFVASPRPLQAQTSQGQISGNVTDATGSVIPGAALTITDVGTEAVHTIVTDSSGFYVVTNLPIGDYTVAVSKAGFTGEKRTGITMTADAHVTADFSIKVGGATELVTVTATTVETLNTTSGELAHVIDTKQVGGLPLNGRNYIQLVTLIPGAVVTNPDIFSVTTSLTSTNQVVNGNRADSANLTVDGAYNQAAGSNGSLINNVGPDFIQEVKIETSNFSAEFGRTSGPAFNIVTKSGTNEIHGTAFEYLRNNYFDARPFFSSAKTHLVYNDFGGGVGGPILKDRLFFFAGEELKRLRQQEAPTVETTPSSAELVGNFSGLTVNGKAVQLFYPGSNTPIPNNDISSLMTTDGKAIAGVYALVNKEGQYTDSTNATNNLTLTPSNPLNFHEELVRLDYKINERNNIFGRWISDHNTVTDPFGTFTPGGLPTTPTNRNRPGQSYLVSETFNLSQSVINQATANFSFVSQHIPPTGNTWERSTYGFQYNKLFPGAGEYPNGIPYTTITNFTAFSGPYFALNSPTTDIQVGDTVSIVKGNHLIKAGGVFIRDRVDQNGRPFYNGDVNFAGSGSNTTGYALADAFLGNFSAYTEASSDPVGHFRFSQPEVFAQDTWKAARKLSLEFGIRWQLISPLYTQGNNYANFDPSVYSATNAITVTMAGKVIPNSGNPFNGLVRAGNGVPADQMQRVLNVNTAAFPFIPDGAPRGLYKMHGAFGPRIGFAYSADDKTSIRGGFGTFYYRPEGNVGFSQVNLQPFLQNVEFDYANLSNISGGTANNTALQGTVTAIDPSLKNPYVEQYSFGVQRELPLGFLLETTYVGNVGHHLLRQPNINYPNLASVAAGNSNGLSINSAYYNPYRGFSAINQNRSDSNSNYNALQMYLTKRRGAVNATIGYTYGKSLGDSSSNNSTLENWQSLSYNYGELSIDRRHAFVATVVYQLPSLDGHSLLLREAAGGWQITGVTRVQTGAYYTIIGNSPLGGLGNRRASYLGGSMYAIGNRFTLPNHLAQYLNPTAFGPPPAGAFGNSGVGSVVLPGLEQGDVTLAKLFAVTKRAQFKIQGDAYNVLNHTNYSSLGTTSTSGSSFGRLNGSYPPRQLQLGAKVIF
jgi:Carboxypeptidase regulatory-like domain